MVHMVGCRVERWDLERCAEAARAAETVSHVGACRSRGGSRGCDGSLPVACGEDGKDLGAVARARDVVRTGVMVGGSGAVACARG